jgi:alkanesulfonate monooxygenase SsuD/methylene tetrahydromethanopterin reductase-like flavin-dependent oxidoreductase (luciferase family)
LERHEKAVPMIALGVCLATMGTSYAETRAAALLLEEQCYDSVWLWDHYVSWNDPREPVLEGLTTLAALAEATSSLKLGTLVANNTNRHPGRLAKIAATLQELAGGRFELGVGGGGWEYEQAIFGIDQGTLADRTGRVAEALQIIPLLWRGEPVSFEGRYYQLTEAIVSPAPNPPPPVIVGARGPTLCRLAGRYADGLNLNWGDRARLPEQLAALDEGLAQRGSTRAGFDLSVHVSWQELMEGADALLERWEELGFTRVMAYMRPPFAHQEIAALAERRGQDGRRAK